MRCFKHPEQDAIAICKACQKGLCRDCTADLGHWVVCRRSHEKDVEALHKMVDRAARVQATSQRAKYVSPAFTGFMGACFVGYGYLHEGMKGFLFVLGCGFLAYSLVVLIANRNAYREAQPNA